MKRGLKGAGSKSGSGSEDNDDAFDDGDDLVARAAEMMESGDDDDDDEDDSDGSQEDSEKQDELDDDLDGDEEAQQQPARKKQKASNGTAHVAVEPGAEGDEVVTSSVLQMQVDALLESVRAPSRTGTKARPLATLLDRLTHVLQSVEAASARPALVAIQSLREAFPFQDPAMDLRKVNWQLAAAPPAAVQIAGGWALGTICRWKGRKGWTVDVLAQMPSSLLQENDVKNNRYFYKRAFFLATLKEAIDASDLGVTADYSWLRGNRRKPVIELLPKDGSGTLASLRLAIRVIPVLDLATLPIPPARLHPTRSNLRPDAAASTPAEAPTPAYNSDLAADVAAIPSLTYLSSIAEANASFAPAVTLLKVWSRQRGLQKVLGLDHIGYVITLLLAYLVTGASKPTRKIPAGSSAWQLFKGCIDAMGKLDFGKTPVVARTSVRHAKAPSEQDWVTVALPTLADPTGLSNLLSGVPLASLELMRYEAQLASKSIVENEQAAFTRCLLTPADTPHLRFDHTARIHLSEGPRIKKSGPSFADAPPAEDTMAVLAEVVRQALGTRVRAISIVASPESASSPSVVNLGLVMDPAQLSRIVEYGPSADKPVDVKAYRAFWGRKVETRRFQDGRILESVVWDADGPAERVRVFQQVIEHILEHHLAIPRSHTRFFARAYDDLLLEAPQIRQSLYSADPKETGFGPTMAAFDQLVKELKGLKGLPLTINSVPPISAGLRYTSTFVQGGMKKQALPYFSHSANFVPVHECLLTFEGSGKWPEDLAAIPKVKAAFLAKIAEDMQETNSGMLAELALDLEASGARDHVALDIVTQQGYAFRLRIHHARERALLEELLLGTEADDASIRKHSELLVAYHRTFTASPAHHAAIAALQHRHPSYSTTVRIMKRWLAAHLMAPHIPEQTIELLCAKVYLDVDSPYGVPSSGVAGFARLLNLLAYWKWREEPLLVPIYTSPAVDLAVATAPAFPEQKRLKALQQFRDARKADPAISKSAWTVATEQDLAGRVWSRTRPSKLVAGRVQELARACLLSLAEQQVEGDADVLHLFSPPLDAFDFILHLDASRVSRHRQAIRPDTKALAKRPSSPQPIRTAFDPVAAFFRRASAAAGDACVLFYDPNGGLVVCGLFNPSIAAKDRDFRITLDYPSRPVKGKDGIATAADTLGGGSAKQKAPVALDRSALLARLVALSDGLVVRTTIR